MLRTGPTDAPHQARGLLLVAGTLSFVGAILSPAPLPVAACGLCLALVIGLLWTRDEPPILLLPALFQWSEVSAPPLSTLWKRVPLNELSDNYADLNSAALYALAAVAVLAIGLRVGSGRSKRPVFAKRLRAEAMVWSFSDISLIAFSAIGLGYLAVFISHIAGPARELFGEIGNIKYVGLFALSYWCLVRRSHMRVLAVVIAFEVVFGMTGFFAEFKYSILTFLVAALAARPRLRPADMASVTAVGILLIGVGMFWTVIKPSYRLFMNQGTGEQVVLEPLNKRLEFIANAARTMDASEFFGGFDKLVGRHGYIEYLALTMQYVPKVIPHENGRLSLAVLQHISVPRFLFPDKPVLPNDTAITVRYTGLPLTIDTSTSISIGYLGELYVDLGFIGALVAVGAIGGITGLAYRKLSDQSRVPLLLIAGLCLMIVLPWAYFGQAYAKNVGAWVASSLIAFVAMRFWLPMVRISRARRPTIYKGVGPLKVAISK
jgi:hypothetical protein